MEAIARRLDTTVRTIERRVKQIRDLGIIIYRTKDDHESSHTLKLETTLDDTLDQLDRALGLRPYATPSILAEDEQEKVLDLYQAILDGKTKKFPYGYFSDRDLSIERMRVMVPYGLGEQWKGSITDCTVQTIRDKKLSGVMQTHFNDSLYLFLKEVYSFLHPWELRRKPVGFFSGKKRKVNARQATIWLVEEMLDYPERLVPQLISKNDFINHRLGGMLTQLYGNSPSRAIMDAYPKKYKEFEFSEKSTKWHGRAGKRNAREAITWLIEKRLRIPLDQVPERIVRKDFVTHGLGGLLQSKALGFCNSARKAVMFAYPGRYENEDFKWYSESRNPL